MQKFVVSFLTFAMITGCLIGCKNTEQPLPPDPKPVTSTTEDSMEPGTDSKTGTISSIETDSETGTISSVETEFAVNEDTYWIAETYYSEDGEGAEGPHPLDPELWSVDLMLYADGTARFRDIHENVFLMDDSYLNLTWEKNEANGHFLFYSKLYTLPVLVGVFDNDVLLVDYMGMTLTMKQASQSDAIKAGNIPAELAGTWLMVSGETEGWQWEAMPDMLSSLVFRVTAYEGSLEYRADLEEFDYYGTMRDAAHDQPVTILNESLYEGCGNDNWSIRIGPEAPKDENGYPTETEIFATLLDYNTLLLQRHYTMDGYPAVSYQTYWRFPQIVSWRTPEYIELDYTNWASESYVNSQGEDRCPPEEMQDFTITLNPDQTCFLFYGDVMQQGTWQIENGGVLLLRGNDDTFWFGGTITVYCIETTYEVSDAYELSLYYNGGILRLKMTGYG